MKIKPELEKMYKWDVYPQELIIEYIQSLEEGKDIEQYEELFKAVSSMPLDENKVKMADVLHDIVLDAKQKENYPYNEPSLLEEIKAARPKEVSIGNIPKGEELKEKIYGAWIGRICGCLLGKPIEGIRTRELLPLLKQSGNYPMHRYIRSSDITQEMMDTYDFFKAGPHLVSFTIDRTSYMPYDDDTNYMVLAMKVIEKYGRGFTPYDMAQEWMALQPKTAYCTAERVAFRNFVNGYMPPYSAIYNNPYREWIGAQIRGDYFGYINPGNPEAAAEMAWRDASISHVKNGIYGEMFVAGMVAAAASEDNIEKIIWAGLAQIPQKSRLYESIMKIMTHFDKGYSSESCFEKIHKKWDEYSEHAWCHTISNAMIVVAALLYGEGDYSKSICLAVQCGFDTDCNGATVGSIIGMRNGLSKIPAKWYLPIHDSLETTIFGAGVVKVCDMVEKTLEHIQL